MKSAFALVCAGLLLATALPDSVALAASEAHPQFRYDHNLRYRYEIFDRDGDGVNPDADSRASTLRLGLSGDVTLAPWIGLFAEFEHVAQWGERDGYNIPTVPSQAKPGFPVIADPEGSELNQAFLRLKGPLGATLKIGRQEVMLNNGRFITISGWRQNHQSFDGATLSLAPAAGWTFDYGYLAKLLRVVGSEASNGRASMDTHFFNLRRDFDGLGTLSAYGVLADFDDEPANSTHSVGLRLDVRRALNETFNGLATLEYARQRDAADNLNEVDADYLLVDLGVAVKGISLRAAWNLLEGSSATDKFNTPLAHPFNGWTELFLVTPSLGADNHGLEVLSLSVGGSVAAVPGLRFLLVGYDYAPDTGSARYGKELDLQLDYAAKAIHPNLALTWRSGWYFADELFSDTLRTSLTASFRF